MAILLPLIAAVVIFRLASINEVCWRNAVLVTSVIWGVLIVGITEGLSLLHLLNFAGVCVAWIIVNGCLGWLIWRRSSRWRLRPSKSYFWQLSQESVILLCGVIGIVSIVGLVSLVAPPNNWDSMAYVMARVVHWIQNRTVDHYPTHYPPQLYNGSWAEFAILHFQLLSGGDRFANLLHWLSLIGSLLSVSLIAKQLGANLTAQTYSVVFCATIPVGILHASTPKNTYIVAFWIVCLVYFGLIILNTQLTWRNTLFLSASLGLAILTKGSAYIYVLPSLLILIGLQFYRSKGHLLKYLFVSMVVILSLNLGHYLRNLYVFGSPTSTYPYKWTNDIYNISVLISNVVRNISLHLTIPFLSGSQWIDHVVIRLHHFLGISPVDVRTTLDVVSMVKPEDFTVNGSPLFEDVAGNSLHFWLIIVVIISVVSHKKLRKNSFLIGYLIITLSAFFLFCFLLKWQPWHSRLHLPVFVLFSPVVGIVLATTWHQKIAQYTLLILLLCSVPYLLFNDLRPLIGETSILTHDRVDQYFAARSQLQGDYHKVTQLAKHQACQNVGLIIAPGSWEYPLWVLLQEPGQPPIRIEHVAVENLTQKIAQRPHYQAFVPCSIIAVGNTLGLGDKITLHSQTYQRYWQSSASRESVQWFAEEQSSL